MKVLAKFLGRVNAFHPPPDFTYVTLKNVDTGEVVDSNAISEKLMEKGIDHNDCEFEVLVLEDVTGKIVSELKKLEPREITQEQMDAIHKEVDAALGNFEI